ncbi:hypothetical protein CR105_13335 [Massilia eurypsychrophila]|jgi:hypothetical protein|uniref:DUF4136 domain-containing protein n=1 Tax=Massilia eurypsychrophila TaxID=1485217 RepID=A0A2G8TEI9_9BURK|nr:DUF4136 domain-containing protein [Massilia eurypsychrophila]PIL44443.1 hypothetical protein CR105_13335 [Massilia eurypsychrophila]
MKRIAMTVLAALTLLLGGCATSIRSDVTTFHEWPQQLPDKSYAFEAPAPQDDTLELRSYQNLVRAQLGRLGFREASGAPALKVSMRFMTTDVPVRVVQAVDPFFYPGPRFGLASRFYRRGWGSSFHHPFYDPFGSFHQYEVVERHVYQREVQVAIKSANDGRRLFDVTVRNQSSEASTPALMPALVQSAFEGFPGPNGGARRIELKQNG